MGRRVPRRRRRGWTHDPVRRVWLHDATGIRFSPTIVGHYGWDAMPALCVEIVGWRQFIAALPTTHLTAEREGLLHAAMASGHDDAAMRILTRRWELWAQEINARTGGSNGE